MHGSTHNTHCKYAFSLEEAAIDTQVAAIWPVSLSFIKTLKPDIAP